MTNARNIIILQHTVKLRLKIQRIIYYTITIKKNTHFYIALKKSKLFPERVKNNNVLKLWSISFDLVMQQKIRIVIEKLLLLVRILSRYIIW